jgi:hypothetical protein
MTEKNEDQSVSFPHGEFTYGPPKGKTTKGCSSLEHTSQSADEELILRYGQMPKVCPKD